MYCDPELNLPFGNCCLPGYNDPHHGYAAVGIYTGNPDMDEDGDYVGDNGLRDVYNAFGQFAVCNYNQYCYDDAVSCFGSCPSSGPGAQACNQGCRFRLKNCCSKLSNYAFDYCLCPDNHPIESKRGTIDCEDNLCPVSHPDAGSICGQDAGIEGGYYECTCGSTAIFVPNSVVPPKAIPKDQMTKYSGNQLRSGTSPPPGGYAQNRLRNKMNKRSKCAYDEIRLPNGVCQKKKRKQTIGISDSNGAVVMAEGPDCCQYGAGGCGNFSVRVGCQQTQVTCMQPEGCGTVSIDSLGAAAFYFDDLLTGNLPAQYQYGETFLTTQYTFTPVGGGPSSCELGCSPVGGSMESACLGLGSYHNPGGLGSTFSFNDDVCGTVTSCHCACYDDCSSTPIDDGTVSSGKSEW